MQVPNSFFRYITIPNEIELSTSYVTIKYCKSKNIIPNSKKEVIIPKAVVIKLTLVLYFSDERTDINFIERIGNTQGIKFKIKPAINDIKT